MLSKAQNEEPHLVEAWDFSSDPPKFGFTAMIWEKDGDFYYHQHDQQEVDITPHAKQELLQKAILIPRDYYLGRLPPPGAPATRAAAAALSDPKVYFKKIEPYMYQPSRVETHTPAHDLEHEMQVCEELSKNSHPNVCRYLGYLPTPDGNHLMGLCFERHGMHLLRAVETQFDFNATTVIEGVRSGLEHLHSLGYVHNDINPRNIVLGKDSIPIIIDFDSCHKIGESLKGKKAGTIDWDHNSDVSQPQNDFYGLEKVRELLQQKEAL
ncbi:kinase-like domain-containing protein [Mycena vulgaris]|nr:kinase-like domain-containing protein [Mycena vulgaris]